MFSSCSLFFSSACLLTTFAKTFAIELLPEPAVSFSCVPLLLISVSALSLPALLSPALTALFPLSEPEETGFSETSVLVPKFGSEAETFELLLSILLSSIFKFSFSIVFIILDKY